MQKEIDFVTNTNQSVWTVEENYYFSIFIVMRGRPTENKVKSKGNVRTYIDAELSMCGWAAISFQLLREMDSLGAEVGIGGIICFGLLLPHLQLDFLEVVLSLLPLGLHSCSLQ